jgi:hypothetical protein
MGNGVMKQTETLKEPDNMVRKLIFMESNAVYLTCIALIVFSLYPDRQLETISKEA